MKADRKTIMLHVRLAPATMEKLRLFAETHEESMSDVVRDWIYTHLAVVEE